MPLNVSDTESRIRLLVWSGFYTPEDVFEVISEEYLDPYSLSADDRAWIEETVEKQADEKRQAEASWSEETDWDRLDAVFEGLDEGQILALHNTGTTQSDGMSDVGDILKQLAAEGYAYRGWAFYHEQDVHRAMTDGVLWLAFGSQEGDSKPVADAIVAALGEAGFTATWAGTTDQRIEISGFDWKKRGLGDSDDDVDHDAEDDDEDEEQVDAA